jgi:hypothetical protein
MVGQHDVFRIAVVFVLSLDVKRPAMMLRTMLLLGYALLLGGCQYSPQGPVINSGSYDWTDQVRDARGFPLPGWGSVIMPSGNGGAR